MPSIHGAASLPKWTIAVVLIAAALAGYFGWHYFYGSETAVSDVANRGGQKLAAIPVTVAKAQKADFPVYLNGLGTVQPYDTVTVRSRVDRQITKIAFRQGQMVKEGDILALIDPRPYGQKI